jgi:S-adenosylmethionine decarboxylase
MKFKHLAARLEGCPRDLLNDEKFICSVLDEIVKLLGMRVLRKVSYVFPVEGVSVIYLWAESHVAFHSWPELGLIDLEIVSCKEDSDVLEGLEIIVREFKAKKVEKQLWEYTV